METRDTDYITRLFDISIIAKKLFILFLLFLPFQNLLVKNIFRGNAIVRQITSYSDELSAVLLLIVLLSFIAIKPKIYRMKVLEFPISIPLLLFLCAAYLSVMLNRVYTLQGVLGIYDVLKNVIIFYLFATLKWRREELYSLIFWIKAIVILLAVVGIIGEIMTLTGLDAGMLVKLDRKRMGFHRVASLTGKGGINYLGMYALLGLFLFYTTTAKKSLRYAGISITLLLIFLTFSRQTWMALFVMMVLTKKRLILPGLLIAAGVVLISFRSGSAAGTELYLPEVYYRSFGYHEAYTLIKQNLFFGVGPGMFGGPVSVMFHSPYYADWPQFYYKMLNKIGNMDSFWPSLVAEVGIIGSVFYLIMWLIFFLKINEMAKWFRLKGDIALYNLGLVFRNYIVGLFIMCFFTGLNKPFVTYTYFALYGIYLSLFYQYRDQENPPETAIQNSPGDGSS